MFLMSLLILFGLFIFGLFFNGERDPVYETSIYMVISIISAFIFIIIFVVTINVGYRLANLTAIEKHITILEEENRKIEKEFIEIICSNKYYKPSLSKDLTTTSNIILIIDSYPELKSSSLVQSKIDSYMKNKEIIVDKKLYLSYKSTYKWFLYFGK